MNGPLRVFIEWDERAGVWYVSNSNVPGLATEAVTVDELLTKLRAMVPELLALNMPQDFDFDTPHALQITTSEYLHCA